MFNYLIIGFACDHISEKCSEENSRNKKGVDCYNNNWYKKKI